MKFAAWHLNFFMNIRVHSTFTEQASYTRTLPGFRPPDVVFAAVHICEVCHKPFPSKSAVLQHLRSCVDPKQQVEASLKKRLAEQQLLPQVGRTLPKVDKSPEALFTCDEQGCKIALASPSELHVHKQTHKEKKRFLCGSCYSCFPSMKELAEHVKSHIPSTLPKADEFECRLCNKNIPKSKLVEHFRMNHFNCSYSACNQTFTSASELKNHQAVAHCKYNCEYCDKELRTLSHYLSHFKSHTLSANRLRPNI